MDSFFERMEPWRKAEGSLHLYVLPSDDEAERFASAQAAIAGIEHLPLMPEAYLHCTVQRLPQFDDEVTQADYTELGDALGALCSELAAFDLRFLQPQADAFGVTCQAQASPAWDALVNGCRMVITDTWGMEPPAPPASPHLSLAYATGAVADGVIESRVENVAPMGSMSVSRLHLVSVTVRPARGTFDFTSLANWDLAPTTR
ncbi:2'-5' RNA ligase family protein [Tessaracoccus sp.]